jgi:hypothetical protein
MMKAFMQIIGTLCMFFFTSLAIAETLVVDQSGAGDYITIQEAINEASEGDTIQIGPGTYLEYLDVKKNVSLIGAGPNFTWLNSASKPDNNTVCGIYIIKALSGTISGMRITAIQHGINFSVSGCSLTIRNCIFDNCANGVSTHDISNTIYLYNNVFAYCNIGFYGYVKDDSFSFTLKGNIIAYNKTYGIQYSCAGGCYGSTQIAYNNVYENGANYAGNAGVGMGDISKNPRFIDAESGNYVLQSSSPCINSGVPGWLDPDGSRSDMGPYATMTAKSFWPYPEHGPIVKELSIIPSAIPKGGKLSIKATGEIR